MNRAIMFSKFIKYDILDALVYQTHSAGVLFKTPVDIYIDIQSVYKLILTEDLLSSDVKNLSINILNLAGHYRHYFYKHGVDTRIYCVNGAMHSNTIYAKENANNQNLFKIVDTVIKYFPLAYYIEANVNASAAILSFIEQESLPKNHSAFVISNDIYSYQIPALVPTAFLLRPSTNTKLISYNTVLTTMYSRNKSVDLSNVSPRLLPIIMAYHKCPELGLEMINTFKTTINLIKSMIQNNQILNNYNSPAIFKNDPEILSRIYLCDLYTNAKQFSQSYENLMNSWRISKLQDVNTLCNILDSKFNTDATNLFNYMFLLDVSEGFVNYLS